MRPFILGLWVFFLTTSLFGQTNNASSRIRIPFFDSESQSNVTVTVCDFMDGQPCPMKYTNVLSNTNLFTVEEQKLIRAAFAGYSKYRDEYTNALPPGAILVGLVKTNYSSWSGESWMARYEYTNSSAKEKISFGKRRGIWGEHLTRSGEGYGVTINDVGGGTELGFYQIKQGVKNGLQAEFINDRLGLYTHYTNGLAFGKLLMWRPKSGNLMLEAEFKEPYDWERHLKKIKAEY